MPAHFNRLILYSEYPVTADMLYLADSASLALMTSRDDVVEALQEVHMGRGEVAVYPSADIG
jgi:hypothetical protein